MRNGNRSSGSLVANGNNGGGSKVRRKGKEKQLATPFEDEVIDLLSSDEDGDEDAKSSAQVQARSKARDDETSRVQPRPKIERDDSDVTPLDEIVDPTIRAGEDAATA